MSALLNYFLWRQRTLCLRLCLVKSQDKCRQKDDCGDTQCDIVSEANFDNVFRISFDSFVKSTQFLSEFLHLVSSTSNRDDTVSRNGTSFELQA